MVVIVSQLEQIHRDPARAVLSDSWKEAEFGSLDRISIRVCTECLGIR